MTRSKYKISDFEYPKPDKITGRISTICRSMACTLFERKKCSPEEENIWKKFFPQKKMCILRRKSYAPRPSLSFNN